MTDLGPILTYIMIGVAILACIISPILRIKNNPEKIKKMTKNYNRLNVVLRSETKSSISSTPTLNLIRESTTPVFSLSSFFRMAGERVSLTPLKSPGTGHGPGSPRAVSEVRLPGTVQVAERKRP